MILPLGGRTARQLETDLVARTDGFSGADIREKPRRTNLDSVAF